MPQSGLFRKPVYHCSTEADSSDENGSKALRKSHELTDSNKNSHFGVLALKNTENTPNCGFQYISSDLIYTQELAF